MVIKTTQRDPAWAIGIQDRRAALWIAPSWKSYITDTRADTVSRILLHPWSAVFVDAKDLPLVSLGTNESPDGLRIRIFSEDAGTAEMPPNRLPIYNLRGPTGAVGPGDSTDPEGYFNRLRMIERVPADSEMFVIGVTTEADLAGLVEARRVLAKSGRLSRLVLVSAAPPDLSTLGSIADRVVHWEAPYSHFAELLDTATRQGESGASSVLVRTSSGLITVDLAPAIDESHPITSAFELIPASEINAERSVQVEDIEAFLTDPAQHWLAYAAGVPFPRHRRYLEVVSRKLEQFAHEGPAASHAIWLPAEDGSGATTTLRQLCYDLAREGYPVLIARPNLPRPDFKQLSAFLRNATGRIGEAGAAASETPWILAFDAEHTKLHWDFIQGLSNSLRKLLRSVLVVSVRPVDSVADGPATPAGANRDLGEAISNAVSQEEALALGQHLMKFLPPNMHRRPEEWTYFNADSIRTTIEGRRSLFWVALRFWLLRMPKADETIRHWLSTKLESAANGRDSVYRGILETAAMARHRLTLPVTLLSGTDAESLLPLAADQHNALGIRAVHEGTVVSLTFAHPMIAEEIMRICMSNDIALRAVSKSRCLNLLDLELHLIGRIIQRPAAGRVENLSLIEELVTTGLRVDIREAPRNYQVRDRIVDLLELAPDSLWDASQIFNHHLAKARRHLAVDPPDNTWTTEFRREQFQLAENHLIDAIHYIKPPADDHKESPLNLQVSLALTYDSRSRFEKRSGGIDVAVDYERKAVEAYRSAQGLDADNSYVLENYARLKIYQAKSLESGVDRTKLLVDAIAMLDWERELDIAGQRAEQILLELASAFELLESDNGRQMLLRLGVKGSEVALVALAKLLLRSDVGDEPSDDNLREAEALLLQVSATEVSWRSRVVLYRIVSKLTPNDFSRRLDLLGELDSTGEFAWPLQLRLEHAILLFQVGDPQNRRQGKQLFQRIRDDLPDRSGFAFVPDDLRFLRDPATQFTRRLKTSIVVTRVSDVGRSFYGIPEGWGTVDVAFRPYLFGRDVIRQRDELDCYIQFTNFGPQAVPMTVDRE